MEIVAYGSGISGSRGYEVGYGTYGRQGSGQTSHGDHFRPTIVGSHITPVGSLQQVTLGDECYEYGKVGHYVKDCHRVQCSWLRVVPSLTEVGGVAHHVIHVELQTLGVAMIVDNLTTSQESAPGSSFGVAGSTLGTQVEVGL
ncbi:hypothetical protein KY289_013549 [Solanum tuberosum]|nr:hypothetical protein KY289_013549 [Solanum tuberosum]